MPEELAIGLDIGTSEVKAIAGWVESDGTLHVEAAGSVASRGVERGAVSALNSCTEAVSEVLRKIRWDQRSFRGLCFTAVDGTHVLSESSSAATAIRLSSKVTPDDVERVLDAAKAVRIGSDQEILHVIPRDFSLDGLDGIKSPVGMEGRHLSVRALVVVASTTAVRSRASAIEDAGLPVDGMVVHAIASAEGVLSDSDRRLGTCVVDIGEGTTSMVVYQGGSAALIAVIPVGGGLVTSDLAVGLGIPVSVADRLKVSVGDLRRMRRLTKERFSDIDLDRSLKGADLSEAGAIVEARLSELFEMVMDHLRGMDLANRIPAGIILTGGASSMVGISELASNVTGLRCQISGPRRILNRGDTSPTLKYACAAGLVRLAFEKRGSLRVSGHSLRLMDRLRGFISDFL